MSGPNPFLAQLYGTGATPEEDSLEKQASILMLTKIAEDREVDISNVDLAGMSVEDLHSAINELSDEWGQEATEVEGGDQEKQAMAEFGQADFLGRAMAHAYVDELDKIASARGEEGAESTLDKLAEARAFEIAVEQGWVGPEGQPAQQQEEDPLAAEVEKQAMAILIERGYV